MLDRSRQQIHAAAQHLRQELLQPDQAEQSDSGVRIELRHEIDIAVLAGLAPRHRAEQLDVANAGSPQFTGVGAQNRDYGVGRQWVANGHGNDM